MRLDDIRTLIDYHYWARDRLLDAVAALSADELQRDLRSSFPSVRDTLVHLCLVEWIWHERWTGHSPTGPPRGAEEFSTLEDIRALWREQEANIRSFLDRLPEGALASEIDYRNMSGQAVRSSFGQMFSHVVNHGSYHRGQVTTMLRQLGAAPPKSLDLITFYRERSAAGTPHR